MKDHQPDFIREINSPLFNRVFYWYCLTLFRRRFRAVWLDDSAVRPSSRSTLYLGNHNSWWDALVPLLINERVLHQRARALMDVEQLRKYPFFRRLGVFSIDREHPRRALDSMEYAAALLNSTGRPPDDSRVKSEPEGSKHPMPASQSAHSDETANPDETARPDKTVRPAQTPQTSPPVGLWFYPEGKLVRPETPIKLEGGIKWLARKLDPARTEIIPFAIHMHFMRSDKPELFVRMGEALDLRMFEMRGDPVRDETQADRIAIILRHLRDATRRDSARFEEAGRPNGGFRLLLGRPTNS